MFKMLFWNKKSKVLRKTASFLKHYDFSEMRYLIQSGSWHHMIVCDAKWSYYQHKNHTKYQFYRSYFQAFYHGHFDLWFQTNVSVISSPKQSYITIWLIFYTICKQQKSMLHINFCTWCTITKWSNQQMDLFNLVQICSLPLLWNCEFEFSGRQIFSLPIIYHLKFPLLVKKIIISFPTKS